MEKIGFLRHFDICNQRDLTKFTPFLIDGKQLGWVTKELAALLPAEMDFFIPSQKGLNLNHALNNFTARTEALANATAWISERYGIKQRKEMYPIINQWDDEPLAQIDRAAVPWFGVKGFGVHINGFTRKNGAIHLWIGERAKDREVDPGLLDNMIAGGQPIGLTLEQNIIKEAHEEAGIDSDIAKTAKPVRTLSYMLEKQQGMRNDVLFVYDLELPPDIIPRNTDGEVAAFHLMSLPEVAAIVRDTNRFKFNCNLVIIDFLIRHGFLTKAHQEYGSLSTYLKL